MKHKWELKRLGDACEINFGQRIVAKDTLPGEYYVYGGGGATFTTQEYNRENCTIVSRFAMSPCCVRFVKGKFFLNDSGLSVSAVNDRLKQSFLDKYLWSKQALIYGLGRGAAQKNLNMKGFADIFIPIPPLTIQDHIVAELDKINEIISDCKEAIRNLDSLAQSLFYDYFGDPITNPKGWRLTPLSVVAPSRQFNGMIEPLSDMVWLLNLDMIEKNTGKIIEYQRVRMCDVGASTYKICPGQVLYSKLRPNLNKVVIAQDYGFCTSELLPLNPIKGIIDKVYLAFLLRTKECVSVFSGKAGGAKMPRTDMNVFRNFNVPVPPLPLQQKFAARIEQIEQQKKLLEQTIANMQTLLDSRMDFWFN